MIMINKPAQAQAHPHDPIQYNGELMFDIMPVKQLRPAVQQSEGSSRQFLRSDISGFNSAE
jgi:hypothetical protein